MFESNGMALTALIRGGMARRRVAKELSGKAWFGEAKRRIATEKLCVELQRHCLERQGEGYEVNCCAVALRSTDRQGEGMAEKSADVICEGKVVHRNDSLRQGFASDALAWKREEMP